MTNPKNGRLVYALAAFALSVAPVSCQRERDHGNASPAEITKQKPEQGPAARQEREMKEVSDLDRPVEELVTLTCEHHEKTFECKECRYETGFVRASADLAREGLIQTAQVARRRFVTPVTLTGEVRFDERRIAHVSSQVEGIIKKVHVALGSRVQRGQALIEIDSIAVGEAQTSYREARGLLELAHQDFERVSELRQENIASEKEFLQAKQALAAARIRADGARSKLDRLGSGGGGAIVLRAPMDGSVLLMHAVSGEVARSDEALITVGDNTIVWVWADLYERDLAAVHEGRAAGALGALVSVKAYPGQEFPGTVDLVSPAMDESSRTVKVRIEVANPAGRLLAGMFSDVKLMLPAAEEVLAIPHSALLEDEGRAFVFVLHHDDYYVRRPVAPGRSWPGWVEIERGLEPGQTVVTEGSFLMKSDVLRSKMGAGCAD
ncbi:MAG: efflux RND transporter periplasmic adaptor subunit [Polyangiaceae bacterium]|nr:efflux RND transporter periplasmic adaptor subunit [Polyangiaceae bacterium]